MKIKELQKELRKLNIGYVVLLRDDENIAYFTQYKEAFCLIIPNNKSPYVLSPEMDYERCKQKSIIKTIKWKKTEKLFELIKKKEKAKTIGINFNKITLTEKNAMHKVLKTKFKDISSLLSNLRKAKTKEEIKIIKQGCKLTDDIMQKMIKNFKKFKTEKEVELFLRKESNKYEGVSFNPIVASGKKSSMPHSSPENKNINKGFCVIDYGIVYKGYCTDITRTLYIGTPTQNEINIYNKILTVQKECIKKAKVGVKVKDLYNYAYKILGGNFTHGLGHGIGIQIHEFPSIGSYSNESLESGMIFTIEPGLYYPNKFGIRIEDDVLVTDKTEVLTKTNKELIIIK